MQTLIHSIRDKDDDEVLYLAKEVVCAALSDDIEATIDVLFLGDRGEYLGVHVGHAQEGDEPETLTRLLALEVVQARPNRLYGEIRDEDQTTFSSLM